MKEKDLFPSIAVLFGTASFVMMFFVMATMKMDALVCWVLCVTLCIVFLSLSKKQNERERIKRERSHFEWRKKCGVERF
jgi:Ca2+/Na+ antiporter